MADEDFTPEELELLDEIIAYQKVIIRHLSNNTSAGEKNSRAELVLINLTPLQPIPSEIESTRVIEQKDNQIEDPMDESLDPVNTKRTMQVTDSLNIYGLDADISDQILKPFILEILTTNCKVLHCPHCIFPTGMDSVELVLVQTNELQLLLIAPVTPRLPPKPPDVSYCTEGFAEPIHSSFKSIGYANLARLDPQYGLYTSVLPPFIYAVMGSSREVVIGPVAVVSLLISSQVSAVVDPAANPDAYRNLVFTTTLFAGIFQAAFRVFRLGFLMDFPSHAALVGFMAGAAIIIVLQQLKGLLGLSHFTSNTDAASVLDSVYKSLHQQITFKEKWPP